MNNEQQKKELQSKIYVLNAELDSVRKEYIRVCSVDRHNYFESIKGNCYRFKFFKEDSDFSGYIKVITMEEEKLSGVFIWTDKSGVPINIDIDRKIEDEWIIEENKITRVKFNGLVKKFSNKLSKFLV